MSENTNSTPQNEDLDLIQLFKLIGQSFKTLFNFFKSILNGLFRVVIYSLKPFVKAAIIKIALTILIFLTNGLRE